MAEDNEHANQEGREENAAASQAQAGEEPARRATRSRAEPETDKGSAPVEDFGDERSMAVNPRREENQDAHETAEQTRGQYAEAKASEKGQPIPQQMEDGQPLPRKGEPGYVLRPGDLGYSPPARIAPPAGMVLSREHLGYNDGASTQTAIDGSVPLAVPVQGVRPGDPGPEKPSRLSPVQANQRLSKMVNDTMEWVMDTPYEIHGELAVVANFFRDLAGRRAALRTADDLGRAVGKDDVDNAQATPPPEFFTVRHMAAQVVALRDVYQNVLDHYGASLDGPAQRKVDQIMGEFEKYADGPTEPPPSAQSNGQGGGGDDGDQGEKSKPDDGGAEAKPEETKPQEEREREKEHAQTA